MKKKKTKKKEHTDGGAEGPYPEDLETGALVPPCPHSPLLSMGSHLKEGGG